MPSLNIFWTFVQKHFKSDFKNPKNYINSKRYHRICKQLSVRGSVGGKSTFDTKYFCDLEKYRFLRELQKSNIWYHLKFGRDFIQTWKFASLLLNLNKHNKTQHRTLHQQQVTQKTNKKISLKIQKIIQKQKNVNSTVSNHQIYTQKISKITSTRYSKFSLLLHKKPIFTNLHIYF